MEKEELKKDTKKEVVNIEPKKYNIDKPIRLLRADEIDCRVNTINEKGLTLLLYKDARVDMAILDETYGVGNWQRTHEVINNNLFCNIEIWNDRINQWVKKQDVGVESYSQAQKGEASDSFKRAGFNIGIGRELYTSPFIWIAPRDDKEIFKNNKGAFTTYTNFIVKEIEYNEKREITKLVIVDDKGNIRFPKNYKEAETTKSNNTLTETLLTPKQLEVLNKNINNETVVKALEYYKKEIKDLTVVEASTIIKKIMKKEEKE